MIDFSAVHPLALFFAVSLVSTATPGPAVLYVTSQGMSGGWRAAAASSLGILAADAVYIILSITGLTAILVASYEVFTLIKWVGAVYLVYLGARLIQAGISAAAATAASTSRLGSTHGALLGGFVLHAGNPKALLYFGSLVPQFVDQTRPLAAQLLALAVVHVLTASLVLAAYSALSAVFRRSGVNALLRRTFQVSAGSFLIGAGVSLMLARKGTS